MNSTLKIAMLNFLKDDYFFYYKLTNLKDEFLSCQKKRMNFYDSMQMIFSSHKKYHAVNEICTCFLKKSETCILIMKKIKIILEYIF